MANANQTEETKVELHVIHTACRGCAFADEKMVWETKQITDDLSVPSYRSQTGCKLGRLDKYRQQGTEVLDAGDENGDEFYIVNGRACAAYRDWGRGWGAGVPQENWPATVRAELTALADVVIPLEDAGDLDKLPATLDSLRALELAPATVTVVNNAGIGMGRVIAAMNKAGTGLNWQVTDVRERARDGSRVDVARLVDIVQAKLKGHFYTLLAAGDELPPSFTADLDRAVVDDMRRFVVLLPTENGVGLTVGLGFHRSPTVNGNKPLPAALLGAVDEADTAPDRLLKDVVEKAKYVAERRNTPFLVEPAEAVCPSLS